MAFRAGTFKVRRAHFFFYPILTLNRLSVLNEKMRLISEVLLSGAKSSNSDFKKKKNFAVKIDRRF